MRVAVILVVWAMLAALVGGQGQPARGPAAMTRHLAAVQTKKRNIARQLRATKHRANAVVGDIHAVDTRLGKIKDDLDDTTDQLIVSQREERELNQALKKAEARRLHQRELIRRRLRAIYLQGRGSVLSVLVGSKSVGDLISRQNFLRSIAKQDREVFEAYTATQREVDEKAKRQAKVVERVHALVANQRAKKAELEDTRAEKGEILEGLRAKQGELRKMLAQFEADESAISAEIAAYRRRAEANPVPAYKGRFIHPVPGRITSRFGMRFHPVLRYTRMHQGVDFGARYGTAIRAVADGRVISAGYGGGYGNRVILDHGGGTMTLYGHCSRLTVQVGQTVRQGQLLGAVGASGLATGPHLHFEVWRNGQRVNPLGFL